LAVSASASPSTVASAGSTALSADAADSDGHAIASWSWSDGGAGGTFSSASAQNPTYTAPANTGTASEAITLTVTATCDSAAPISASASTTITVEPAAPPPHTLTVRASVNRTVVASGGKVGATAVVSDSAGYSAFAYEWSDGGAGGTFSAPGEGKTTYTAPAITGGTDQTIALTVTVTCAESDPPLQAVASTSLTVRTRSAHGAHNRSRLGPARR
jgi:hypothetical protein